MPSSSCWRIGKQNESTEQFDDHAGAARWIPHSGLPARKAPALPSQLQNMKSKQLANVLIKILGLSILVESIPAVVTGLFRSGTIFVSLLVSVALGICLILKSRDVAGFLFKDEEE
jgi:hypothetical protein